VRQLAILSIFAAVIVSVGLAARTDRVLFESDEGVLVDLDVRRAGSAREARSGYLPEASVATPEEALQYSPLGLVYFLTVPLPWQLGSIRQNLIIPENLFWLALYPLMVVGGARALRSNRAGVVFLLLMTVGMCIVYTLLVANVGTAYRMRSQVWLLWAPFAAWGSFAARDGALARINAALRRLGHEIVAALPQVEERHRAAFGELFKSGLLARTGWLTLAYFAHITTFYFILKWVPKIVVDLGHAPSAASGVLVWANVGGLSGALLFSLLTRRWSLWRLLAIALVGSAIMVTVFGHATASLGQLSLAAGAAGFFANAAVVCLYALMAEIFPVQLRAGGTGFVIGVGRGGAAIAPVIAGALFGAGFGLAQVALCMALGSVVAALALLRLRGATRQPAFA